MISDVLNDVFGVFFYLRDNKVYRLSGIAELRIGLDLVCVAKGRIFFYSIVLAKIAEMNSIKFDFNAISFQSSVDFRATAFASIAMCCVGVFQFLDDFYLAIRLAVDGNNCRGFISIFCDVIMVINTDGKSIIAFANDRTQGIVGAEQPICDLGGVLCANLIGVDGANVNREGEKILREHLRNIEVVKFLHFVDIVEHAGLKQRNVNHFIFFDDEMCACVP